MLTLFAIPKAFEGHIGVIQCNAIKSWTLLQPRPEIILFGDEKGTAEICRQEGLTHVPEAACNEYGTPLLSDLFDRAQKLATYDLLAYVNADIILTANLPNLIRLILQNNTRFLAIVRRWNIMRQAVIDFTEPNWEDSLIAHVKQFGKAPFDGVDCFIFPRLFYEGVPPFALGRGYWDDWLIWKARKVGGSVIDLTNLTMIIHQNHSETNSASSSRTEESLRNYKLNGGWRYFFHQSLPTHIFSGDRLLRKHTLDNLLHFYYRFLPHLLGRTYAIRHSLGLCRNRK